MKYTKSPATVKVPLKWKICKQFLYPTCILQTVWWFLLIFFFFFLVDFFSFCWISSRFYSFSLAVYSHNSFQYKQIVFPENTEAWNSVGPISIKKRKGFVWTVWLGDRNRSFSLRLLLQGYRVFFWLQVSSFLTS